MEPKCSYSLQCPAATVYILLCIQRLLSFLLMGRVNSNRKTAEALRKTIRQLESDPTVDSTDPAFVQLKCTLLQRLIDYETDTAEALAHIHLVEPIETDSPEPVEIPKPANF
jgi:hypothetical protein